MQKVTDTELLHATQRALLFNIIPSVSLIFVEINEKNALEMWIYMDHMPDEDESDIYYAVSGEILGNFHNINDSDSRVQFFDSSESFENIPKLKHLVYARHDNIK